MKSLSRFLFALVLVSFVSGLAYAQRPPVIQSQQGGQGPRPRTRNFDIKVFYVPAGQSLALVPFEPVEVVCDVDQVNYSPCEIVEYVDVARARWKIVKDGRNLISGLAALDHALAQLEKLKAAGQCQ